MTGPGEGNSPFLPDETLGLATAIGQRYAQVQQTTERIAAAVKGEEYNPEPEVLERSRIGWAALMLARVAGPGQAIPMEQVYSAMRGGTKGYEALAAEINGISDDPEFALTAEGVKGAEAAMAEEFHNQIGVNEEQMMVGFAAELRAAIEVAAEHGVDLATVYIDDDLYYEAAAREATPQQAVQKAVDAINGFNGETLMKSAGQVLQAMIPKDILAQMSPEDLDEMVESIKQNPQAQALLAEITVKQQEGLRQAYLYQFIRTYGLQRLAELTSEQRDVLLPQSPPVEELSALLRDQAA